MKIEPVKGTRDFYPELMQEIKTIFNSWSSICKKYGYEEMDGPLLEPVQLWQLKSGTEIPEQMYTLTDKSKRKLAIRPELTPTLARMVAEKQKSLTKPIKWFSIPRCYRYEQPQSGRLREFFQLNVDCLGNDDTYSDAEVIAISIDIMLKLGFTNKDFYVRISDRTLLNIILEQLGVKDTKDIFRLIDKKLKITQKEFDTELKKLTKKTKPIKEFLELDNIKSLKKFVKENKISVDSSDLEQLFKYLDNYGYKKYIKFDPTITRGFDYYTKTVFEVFDKSLKYRAIAGGGRYDNLVEDFGGEKISGVGFGMGDVVLSLFMKDKKLMPEYKRDYDYYVTIIPEKDDNTKLKEFAIKVAQKLREKGKVFLELNTRKLNKALAFASRNSIPNVVIIGKTEMQNNSFIVKEMQKKKEKTIKL